MTSIGAGVGSHIEANGNDAKKAQTLSAIISPKLPITKSILANAGKRGIHKLATRPIIRDQKHIRGSTIKLVIGATRENLLKWNKSRGKVPSMAAAVRETPAINHLRIVMVILRIFETGVDSPAESGFAKRVDAPGTS